MVVGENVKSGGKGGRGKKVLVDAVALAVLALGSVEVALADPIQIDNTNSPTTTYFLAPGDSIEILNSGSISSPTGDGLALLSGSVYGYISNAGSISAPANAVNINPATSQLGGFTNSGGIYGGSIGVAVNSANLNAGINNALGGTISGGVSGLQLFARSTVTGGLTNSGSIYGGNSAIAITGSSVSGGVKNTADGVINGGTFGLQVASLIDELNNVVINSTVSGGITNSGSIYGGNVGLGINSSYLSGGINNIAGGSISGGGSNGLQVVGQASVVDGITNSGYISGPLHGLDIFGFSRVDGGVNNNGGTIVGGVRVSTRSSVTGGIANAGAIYGNNVNSGGAWFGIGIGITASSVAGGINNAIGGVISGSASGINVAGISWTYGTASPVVVPSYVSQGITNSGSLYGGYQAIRIEGSQINGGINNDATGSIAGGTTGVFITSQYNGDDANPSFLGSSVIGGITNSGSIYGSEEGIHVLYSTIGGGLNNIGTVQGGYSGLMLDSVQFSEGITNSGKVIGGTSVAIGIFNSQVHDGIKNAIGGVIDGASTGVLLYNSSVSGGITNSGIIAGNGYAGIYLYNGNSIAGGLTNNGLVQSSRLGIGISNSSISDGIRNNVNGTISGGVFAGILVDSGSTVLGGITNSGSIYGDVLAIGVNASKISGGINNSGSISTSSNPGDLSDIRGLAITNGSTVLGGITNSGSIYSNYIGLFIHDSQVESGIINSGTIYGEILAVGVNASKISGGINNSGTIATGSNLEGYYGQQGLAISNGSTVLGGITNSGSIYGKDVGLSIYASQVEGGIANSGTIAGSASGLLIASSVTVLDGLTNSGYLYGNTAGLIIADGQLVGGLTNSGTIFSPSSIGNTFGAGVWIYTRSSVAGGIANSGSIFGKNAGLSIYDSQVEGGIANSGTIGASISGLVIGAGATLLGGLTNSGYLYGNTAGLTIANAQLTGGLTNSGTIVSTAAPVSNLSTGLVISNGSSLAGGIVNSGSIYGRNVGVSIVSSHIDGGVTNSGIIRGGLTGLFIANQSSISGGITNSGTISSIAANGVAIQTAFLSDGIHNSGSIAGGIRGLYIHSGSSISGGIANSGVIQGGGVGAYISTAFSISGGITNSGSIIGGSIGLGIYTSQVDGGIQNLNGTIGGNQRGLRLDQGAVINDGIANSGLIYGNVESGIEIIGSQVNAGLNNSVTGIIQGGGSGIHIIGAVPANFTTPSVVTGGIANSGTVAGNIAIAITGSQVIGGINNSIDGLVAGNTSGIRVNQQQYSLGSFSGYSYEPSTVADGITNAGSIYGGYVGVEISGSRVDGGIINSGTIQTASTGGSIGNGAIYIGAGSSVAGGVVNRGLISSASNGLAINGSSLDGGITNSGTIFAVTPGIALQGGSSLAGGISNSGLIQSAGNGVLISNSSLEGGINNNGTIRAQGFGVALNSSSSVVGGINNSGSIYGNIGIAISASRLDGGINNTVGGSIVGLSAGIQIGQGALVDAINNAGGYINSISNSGVINNVSGGAGIAVTNAGIIYAGIANDGRILGNTGIKVAGASSAIVGGITNVGVIAGSGGVAIAVDSASNRLLVNNTVSGYLAGTIIGAISGNANVNNSGLWSLQTYTGLSSGSPVSANISGDYSQASTGTLRIGVEGTTAGAYSNLNVDGVASFADGATLNIQLNGSSGVIAGDTLSGVVVANSLAVNLANLKVSDNSVLYNFNAMVDPSHSNWIDISSTASGVCYGEITHSVNGPCLVGFDAPSILVNPGVSITGGVSGIQVLSGVSDGAGVNGYGINNQGTVSGSLYGVQFLSLSTLTGGITNTGLIVGQYQNSASMSGSLGAGIFISAASLSGGILNSGSIAGGNTGIYLMGSTVTGGISNSGQIEGSSTASYFSRGINLVSSTLSDGIVNDSSGTIIGGTAGINLIGSSLSGGITNSGLIQANSSLRFGVGVYASSNSNINGSIFNQGTITGLAAGLVVSDRSTISGGIENRGLISGGLAGIGLSNSVISLGITNSGTIQGIGYPVAGDGLHANSAFGVLFQGFVPSDAVFVGPINNQNLIQGHGGNASGVTATAGMGGGIFLSNTPVFNMNGGPSSVALDNSIRGTIQGVGGDGSGATVVGGAGLGVVLLHATYDNYFTSGALVSNQGAILGLGGSASGDGANSGNGIAFFLDHAAAGNNYIYQPGVIDNAGLLSGVGGNAAGSGVHAGYGAGVELAYSSTIGGLGINNVGTIQGIGGQLLASSSGTAGFGVGINIYASSILSGISNSGLILGSGGSANGSNAIGGDGIGLWVQNATAGYSDVSQTGGIHNGGWIIGAGADISGTLAQAGQGYGVAAINGATIGGSGIYNAGTIQGIGGSLLVGSTGSAGNGAAIYLDSSRFTSGVSNTGFMIGSGGSAQNSSGVLAGNGFAFEVANGAAIGGFGVYNAGTIQGIGGNLLSGSTGNAGMGAAIYIRDSGVIAGLSNTGLIMGVGGSAVGNSATSGGGIGVGLFNDASLAYLKNSGTIQGLAGSIGASASAGLGGFGIFVGLGSSIAGGISNSGLIRGSTNSIYVDSTSYVPSIAILGNNSASFSGDVYAPNTPVTVVGGATFTLNNIFSVSGFSNQGTIVLNPGNSSTIAGGSGAGSATFTQTTTGALQVNVNSLSDGGYGRLFVDGNSSIDGSITLNLAGASVGLTAGGTITGVVVDNGSVTTLSGFNVTSNSAKLVLTGVVVGNELDLVASAASGVCAGTVSANTAGPCIVTFDSPSIQVNPGVTITGSDGIKVLSGISDGASVSGFGINNQGTVIATGNRGIYLQSGATLTGGITNSGLVNGYKIGLNMEGASLSGGINNSGVISGSQGIILVHSSVTGSIVNSGLITGGNAALNLGASSVDSIINTGTISAGIATSVYIAASTINGQFYNSGSIGGEWSAVAIFGGSTVTGGIVNAGTIKGGNGLVITAAYSGASTLPSKVSGGIINTGYIGGNSYGIGITSSQLAGGVANAGTIYGGDAGVALNNSTISGGLSNSLAALISGGNDGLRIANTNLSGGINNSGSIYGGSAGITTYGNVSIGGGFNNAATGVIIGEANVGVVLNGVNLAGGITNSGSIYGAELGLRLIDATIAGGLNNALSGALASQGYAGVSIENTSLTGGITNSGSIYGGANGIAISGSYLAGNIINTGTIVASNSNNSPYYVTGMSILGASVFEGSFTNTGLIKGVNTSVNSVSGDASALNFSGRSGQGVILEGNNSISAFMNSGAIKGVGADVASSYSGEAITTASVYGGAANGVSISYNNFGLLISNSGLIEARGGQALNSGTFTQVIADASSNSFYMDVAGGSVDYALRLSGPSSALNNTGSIIGQAGSGQLSASIIQQYADLSVTPGSVALFVGGGSASALSVSNQDLTLNNQGLIQARAGNAEMSHVNIQADSRSNISLNSSGGGASGAFVSSFIDGSSDLNAVTNSGTISSYAGSSVISSVVINQVANSSSINGSIYTYSSGGSAYGMGVFAATGMSVVNSGLISAIGGDSSVAGVVVNATPGTNLTVNALGGAAAGFFTFGNLASAIERDFSNSGTISAVGGNAFVSIAGNFDPTLTSISVSGGSGVGAGLGSFYAFPEWSGNIVNTGLIEGKGGSASSLNVASTALGGQGVGLKIGAPYSYSSFSGFTANSLTVRGVVSNSGIIQGVGGSANSGGFAKGGAGYGVYLGDPNIGCQPASSTYCGNATIAGAFVNTGLIQGVGGSAAGTSVAGASGYGLAVVNGSLIASGITNSGLIKGVGGSASGIGASGDGYGIYVDAASSIAGGINNSGVISGVAGAPSAGATVGNAYSIYAPGGGLTAISIAGSNSQLIGDVYAPNATLAIQSGANFTNNNSFNVDRFVIQNGGSFNFVNAPSSSASVIGGITTQNGFENAGKLSIGTYSPAITGNFAQSNTGTFASTITNQSNYGRLGVSGSAVLAGSAVVTLLNPASAALVAGSTLAGLISANTLTGTFSDVTTKGSWLYSFAPVYTPNEFDMVVASKVNLVQVVMANNNPAAVGSANMLDGVIANPASAPNIIPILNQINSIGVQSGGAGVSNAISQTLPAMVGAGSLIAAQTQQGLNQIMQGRQNQLRGLSSGEEFIGNRNAWMKGFGSWANQGNVNNVSGYKVNTGGLALGVDFELSPKANIGAVFAFANSGVNSNSTVAASGMTVNTYQLGAYGDYSIKPDLQANYQVDFGLNNNKEYRNLSAFNGVQGVGSSSSGVNANANYNSYIGHLGAGLRQFVPVAESTTFIPSVRADYTTVQSAAYSESGAGTLNLNANSQSYNMLLVSADLRADQMLSEKLKLSANVGAGYNTLNNQVQMTTAFQGGGPAFTTNGLQTSPWLYNAGLGMSGRINKDLELNVRYDTQFSSSGYNNQMISAKLKIFY